MKQILFGFRLGSCMAAFLIIAGGAVLAPESTVAAGSVNSGGAAGGKTYEARVTGYITAIDPVTQTIQIGASYYGSGQLKVTSSSKITVGASNGSFSDL